MFRFASSFNNLAFCLNSEVPRNDRSGQTHSNEMGGKGFALEMLFPIVFGGIAVLFVEKRLD